MNHIQKKDRDDYTKTLFDALWDGKRVWDAIVDLEVNRHILASKALNCKYKSYATGLNGFKYEMDWKQAGFTVVLKGVIRPSFGILSRLFGDSKKRCFRKAVEWLDDASDKEQQFLFTVYFLAGDTLVQGAERNHKLVQKLLYHISSIQPEVSPEDANLKADEFIKNGSLNH